MDTSVARPDAPVRELFEAIAAHADLQRPNLPAVAEALLKLSRDHDYLAPIISHTGDVSGPEPIHVPERGPRLFLAHRRSGEMGAIHDHSVWVALAPVTGVETHRQWRPVDPAERRRIEIVEEQALAPATCVTLQPPDDIHDHGHRLGVGDAAYVLILLGDDQFRYRRNEWDTTTGRHRILEPGDRGRWLASEPFPG